MIVIQNEFNIGEIVYLITDVEQSKRIVLGFLYEDGTILYKIACVSIISYNRNIEISREKTII